MTSKCRVPFALAAILMACCPLDSITAADIYNAVNPDEAQSVPTHSDYALRIGPRIDYGLFDLHFVTPLIGYAVGTGLRPGQAPIVYKTTDGGESWLVQPLDCGWNPKVIAFADEFRGLITFHDTSGCPEACQHRTAALLTDDGGETWSRVDYLEFQGHIMDVVFDGAGRAFGLLFHMRRDHGTSNSLEFTYTLLRSDDVGRSWLRIRELPQPGYGGIRHFPLRLHEGQLYLPWADGSIKVFDTQGKLLETLETGFELVDDLVVVSESTLLATAASIDPATYQGTHHLIRSIDGGGTWQILLDGYALIAFARSSDEFGVIVNRGHMGHHRRPLDVMAHTTDGGGTWRESESVLSLRSSIRRRVHHPSAERDLLLLHTRVVEIDHFDRE